MKQRRFGNVVAGLAGVLLLVAAGWGLWQHEYLVDWLRAERFVPSEAVAQLTVSTTMTERGTLLFYTSEPQLESAEQFNRSCERVEKGSAVLGCYVNRQIYIYSVDNHELEGIEEVTAAHEMLHAAYDRLSQRERRDVNSLLNQAALSLRADQQFTERLEAYDFVSSDEKHNELHSIIGTEISELDPALEAHYARYFTDRSAVVSLYGQYQAVFVRHKERARQLAEELDRLADTINSLSTAYQRTVAQLESDVAAFNTRADGGGFESQAAFSSARALLVARQSSLSADYRHITEQHRRYDALLEQYDGIAQHLTSLSNSIDSRVSPAPEVR